MCSQCSRCCTQFCLGSSAKQCKKVHYPSMIISRPPQECAQNRGENALCNTAKCRFPETGCTQHIKSLVQNTGNYVPATFSRHGTMQASKCSRDLGGCTISRTPRTLRACQRPGGEGDFDPEREQSARDLRGFLTLNVGTPYCWHAGNLAINTTTAPIPLS